MPLCIAEENGGRLSSEEIGTRPACSQGRQLTNWQWQTKTAKWKWKINDGLNRKTQKNRPTEKNSLSREKQRPPKHFLLIYFWTRPSSLKSISRNKLCISIFNCRGFRSQHGRSHRQGQTNAKRPKVKGQSENSKPGKGRKDWEDKRRGDEERERQKPMESHFVRIC